MSRLRRFYIQKRVIAHVETDFSNHQLKNPERRNPLANIWSVINDLNLRENCCFDKVIKCANESKVTKPRGWLRRALQDSSKCNF